MRASKPFLLQNTGGHVGLAVDFAFDRSATPSRVWLLVPSRFEGMLSAREDVFLPALVFLALVNRDDLDLDGAHVDPLLLRNLLSASRQHESWVRRFRTPALAGYTIDESKLSAAEGVASFYSGGVDSLFTLTRHSEIFTDDPTRVSARNIDFALHVFHLDSPDEIPGLAGSEAALARGAAKLGAEFVPVYSNIMSMDPVWRENYARVTHGAGLSTVAHALSRKVGRCLLGSSHTFGELHPWGSGPLVDPLYSSQSLSVTHDGSTFTRFEKTELICRSPDALAAINVCDALVPGTGYINCSHCQKCLRTMTAIDLCGAAHEKCPAFDWRRYSPKSFGEIYFKNWSEQSFAEELVEAAEQRGRADIARSVRSALSKSRLLTPVSKAEDLVRHTPLAQRLKKRLMALRAGVYRSVGLRR